MHHQYSGPFSGAAWGTDGAEAVGPIDLPGHLMLHAQRHVHGPTDFTDAESGNFTFACRHVERILLEVTGAERIYTVLIGETGPHLHAHLIPRFCDEKLVAMGVEPKHGSAMGVFDLCRACSAEEGKHADRAEVARVEAEMTKRLAESPMPMRGADA